MELLLKEWWGINIKIFPIADKRRFDLRMNADIQERRQSVHDIPAVSAFICVLAS
jgi:hypothetical protein